MQKKLQLTIASLLVAALMTGCNGVQPFFTELFDFEHPRSRRDRLYEEKVLLLAKQNGYASTEEYYAAREKEWSAEFRRERNAHLDKVNSVKLGITYKELLEIMGSPSDINTTEGIGYVHNQIVYQTEYYGTSYFYFEDGILANIQK